MNSTSAARKATAPEISPRPDDIARRWIEDRIRRASVTGKFAEFAMLTPGIARLLLERNQDNRSVSVASVAKLVSALQSGDWEDNGESIKISISGELNDGQHRCHAVSQANISVPVLFVFGVSRESRKTVDVGVKRSAAAMLGMSGVPQAALTASALKCMLNMLAGVYLSTHRSIQELERALQAHPDILQGHRAPASSAIQFHQSTGAFVAVHYLIAKRHPAKAAEFFQMLADGTAPTARHPVALLRKRLTDNLVNKAKLPKTEVAAILIKAIQAFVNDRQMSSLRWRSEGDKAESFPKVL